MDWIDYDKEMWYMQPLPPEHRRVLVQIPARQGENMGLPPTVAVGYLRYAAGDPRSPHFIVPGVGSPVVAWCDCLGDGYKAPLDRYSNEETRKFPKTVPDPIDKQLYADW